MAAKQLPTRPRSHVLETISRQYVEYVLPAEWICRRIPADYGLDMRVEIVEDKQVTGCEFSIQLRSTDSLTIHGDSVTHYCKVSTAQYFLQRPEPVMYAIYDAKGQVAYWLWVKPYLRDLNKNHPEWRDQQSVQIRIPRSSLLTRGSIPAIADHVRACRAQTGPMQAKNLRDKELTYLHEVLLKTRFMRDHYTPLAGIAEVPAVSRSGPWLDLPEPCVPPGFERLVENNHNSKLAEVRREFVNDLVMAVTTYKYVLLLGEPGSGKTTTLRRLAYEYANAAMANAGAPLPLLVPLAGYTNDEPFDDYLARHLGPLAPYLEFYRTSGRLILLLDGLDEMPRARATELVDRIQAMLDKHTYGALVITCRTSDCTFRLGNLHRIEVLPLDEMRVSHFLKQHLGKTDGEQFFWIIAGGNEVRALWEAWQQAGGTWAAFWNSDRMPEDVCSRTTRAQHKLWKRIEREPPPLLTIGRNPCLLLLITIVCTNTHVYLALNRTQLLGTFVDALIEREQRRHPEKSVEGELQKNGLAALAYSMQMRPGCPKSVYRSWAVTRLCKAVPNCDPERLLCLATNATLLDADSEAVRFRHPLLQQYFAALELRRRLAAGESLDHFWPPDRWWKPSAWDEIVILLAGMEPAASKLLGELAFANPVVATRCLLDGAVRASEATRESVLTILMARMIDERQPPGARIEAGDALARIGDTRPGVGVHSSGLPDIVWCYIPSGPPAVDSAEGKETSEHCDSDITEGYLISRYHITHAQFDAFVKAGGYQKRRYWTEAVQAGIWQEGTIKTPYDNQPREGPCNYGEPFSLPNHPVVGITWYEAMAFCRWFTEQLRVSRHRFQVWRNGHLEISHLTSDTLIVRLPSEFEWEKAAQGTDRRRYPWGEKPDPDKSNCLQTYVGSTSPVGCFPGGVSQYGLEDSVGNVWVWTQSLSERNPSKRELIKRVICLILNGDTKHLDPKRRSRLHTCSAIIQASLVSAVRRLYGQSGRQIDGSRILRGGAFVSEERMVRCDASGWASLSASDMSLGFRVVASAAPRSDSCKMDPTEIASTQ